VALALLLVRSVPPPFLPMLEMIFLRRSKPAL